MRTTVHVALILLLGVGLGLAIRMARVTRSASGPGPDDVVYTNDVASDGLTDSENEAIDNPSPSHPPEDENWLSRFELIERSGETIKSEALLGQPYVVSFFFSTCPSICVQQNQKLKELQDQFEGQGVRFVAISVDPETDTPERLREYAAEAAEFERSGKPVPGVLQDQIKSARELITENREFVRQKEVERESIAAKFDADIARYRELIENN